MARLRSVDGVVPAVLANGKRRGPGGGAERSIDMDAVEFIRERNRMCKHFRGCAECPAGGMICNTIWDIHDAEKLVQVVEAWAKEHPHKTRQSEFLKRWPGATRDSDGVVNICPKLLDADISCTDEETERTGLCKPCDDCQREFWMQEVE